MTDTLPASARYLPPNIFAGKVAVVTGGGTGLGLQISRGFAALGATVVIASRSTDNHAEFLDEAQEHGWSAEGVALDVREPAHVREFMDGVVERHGKLDHLVNNAAGNFVCPAERMSSNAWRTVLGIVLDGTFYCSKYAGRHMLKAGSGTQMNVVATYAMTGMAGVCHSASAKAGVLALAKSLSVEWASRGVRVNAIAPGPFQSDGAKQNLWPEDGMEERIRESIPLGRFASTDEVAGHCLYLASPAAAYITGECLVIDGGLSVGAGRMWEPGQRVKRKRDQ
ncbi:MAG: NAD(P)-dependent dehydrogenase (short-subunit alcohol dehydrogenase family) [Planctomycetota bacterium]|jgi:NAD(P)-dependent dehydrogenase (short-subunit alcohol dehydrogenase family)